MLSNGAAEGDGSMVGEVQTVSSSTLAIHADSEEARVPDGLVDAAAPPISVSTTFEAGGKYSYSRCEIPPSSVRKRSWGRSTAPLQRCCTQVAWLQRLLCSTISVQSMWPSRMATTALTTQSTYLQKKHNAGKTRKGRRGSKNLLSTSTISPN